MPAEERDEMGFAISYLNDSGTEIVLEGETLEQLAAELKESGYEGSSIGVRDEHGFICGWVAAGEWRAA